MVSTKKNNFGDAKVCLQLTTGCRACNESRPRLYPLVSSPVCVCNIYIHVHVSLFIDATLFISNHIVRWSVLTHSSGR